MVKHALERLAVGLTLALSPESHAEESAPVAIVRSQESYTREFAARLQSCMTTSDDQQTLSDRATLREILEKGIIAHGMIEELTADLESEQEGTTITDRSGERLEAKKIEYTQSPDVTAWAFIEREDHMLFSGLVAQRQMPLIIEQWDQRFLDISFQLHEECDAIIAHWRDIDERYAHLPEEKEQARKKS